MLNEPDDAICFLRVVCNDRRCQALFYVTSREDPVECFQCGQFHAKDKLRDVQEVPAHPALDLYVKRLMICTALPKRGTEMVKVLGLSNYYCKLLSPLLTKYGMDKITGQAKLLKEMNKGDIFDCSLFGDRAFLIESEHIAIQGFGRDNTGSMIYLSETLKLITSSNGGEERLLPIHADGDGHCLVHAISRALVGRELFWHPLRICLKRHFECNLDKFKELFKDFIDTDEWQSIIDECDPEFKPPEGELHGLRNIHIFGLANVLRRPIILLDSLECMKKSGDYSALFLPGFIGPEGCRGKDNTLNKPICIAWSSYSHNHYIPLVGVEKMPLPVLPPSLIPKVWGMPQSEIMSYIEFDDNGSCTIGGNRVLSDNYIQRLVNAMEGQFYEIYGVHPSLVADTKLFLCSDNGVLNTKPSTVINKTKIIVSEERLFRCGECKALSELHMDVSWFRRGGLFFTSLLQTHKKLVPGKPYPLPIQDLFCFYDPLRDVLIPDMRGSKLEKCHYCQSTTIHKLRPDGSKVGEAPTVFNIQNKQTSKICNAPDKLDKSQNDDLPKMLTLKIEWNDAIAEDVIPDFQLVRDEVLGEAISHIASTFIKKHFPGEMCNAEFHSHVCKEILKKIGKSLPVVTEPVHVISEKANSYREESKMEALHSNYMVKETESKPSASELQFIKIVSPTGQQANLNLSERGVTYFQLQEWILKEFGIPVQNQRIKMGFPPKELEAPCNNGIQTLPLKHGDRLMVENCPKPDQKPRNTPYIRNAARDKNSQPMLSAVQNEVLWNFAKFSPEQFRKGGHLYEAIASTQILTDLVHLYFDKFPTKVFSYNYVNDCIELCVKPYGHFEITMDLDSRIEQVQAGESVKGHRDCPVMSLKIGHKDPVINKATKKSASSTAQSSAETLPAPLLRKGPGFSVLTSPESSDRMDVS